MECKEKRIYGWCASKNKNTDTAWEVVGESGYGDIHHLTRPQQSVSDPRNDRDPPRRQAPPSRDG